MRKTRARLRLLHELWRHFVPPGRARHAELGGVERGGARISLARETKGHVHVAHISTREALEAVRAAKKAKLRVTAEVTPHHFTLIDENVGEFDTHYKMNPPLRPLPTAKR